MKARPGLAATGREGLGRLPVGTAAARLADAADAGVTRVVALGNRIPVHGALYVLLLTACVLQALSPIHFTDTDLWYHMSGGRAFFATGSIPDTPFYAFAVDANEFVNYYWAFQALVHQVYDHLGYGGLIALRCLLLGASGWLLIQVVAGSRRDKPGILIWLLGITGILLLEARADAVRPHLFSYLLLLSFLYILEHRRRWAPLLPLLTVVWVNLHGIVWPLIGLLCGSYFIAWLWQRLRGGGDGDRGLAVSLLLCAPALLLTPHGTDLLMTPFDVAGHVDRYVWEMMPVDASGLFATFWQLYGFSFDNGLLLLMIGLLFATFRAIFRRDADPARLLLAGGGLLLLTRGERFVWEWVLLSLPFVRDALQHVSLRLAPPPQPAASGALRWLIALLPGVTLVASLSAPAGYPFDRKDLPVGITRFLQAEQLEGRLMVPANRAGYVHWAVGPKIKVPLDLQMSLTSDWDVSRLNAAYANRNALVQFLQRYRPDFVAIPVESRKVGGWLADAGAFEPVFFDDVYVLYADRDHHPALTGRYRFDHVDPFNLAKSGDDIDGKLTELSRVAALDSDGQRVHHGIAQSLFGAGRYTETLAAAEIHQAKRPWDPNGYQYAGNALRDLGRCREALAQYDRALDRVPDDDTDLRMTLQRDKGSCHYLLQDFDAAFDNLWAGMNPFKYGYPPELYYQLAVSAVAVGRTDTAKLMLRLLLWRSTPAEAVEVWHKAEAFLADLQAP